MMQISTRDIFQVVFRLPRTSRMFLTVRTGGLIPADGGQVLLSTPGAGPLLSTAVTNAK
jgi:hypothetical protein